MHIGPNELRLVKMESTSLQKPVLSDYRMIPFETGFSITQPQFQRFFKTALVDFIGSRKTENMHIWSFLPASGVDLRYLKIPRVPAKQIARAVYWTYHRETPFNEAEVVFDYQCMGEIQDSGVAKIECIAYTASRREIESLRVLFEKSGFPLSGITIFPFVFQNFIKRQWIQSADTDMCSLFIGMDWSGISIFSHRKLMVFRSIRTGIDGMLQSIMEEMQDEEGLSGIRMPDESDHPDEAGETDAGAKERTGEAFRLLMSLGPPSSGTSTAEKGRALSRPDIVAIIRPVLERLVGQVERTFKHYALNFGQRTIGKIYLSGVLGSCAPLAAHIQSALEIPVEAFDPLTVIAAARGAAADPLSRTDGYSGSLLPAIGLALSSNEETPNFLYTYKDKVQQYRLRMLQRSLSGVFAGALMICGAVFGVQHQLLENKAAQQVHLEQQLNVAGGPVVDQNRILQQVARIQHHKKRLSQQAEKYYCPAILSELSAVTPPDVRLIRIDINPKAVTASDKKTDSDGRMRIEGIVVGERRRFDTILAAYLFDLKQSPLFGNFTIENRSFEFYLNKEVLRFTGYLELM